MIKDYIIKNKKNGVNPQILWTNLWKKKKLKNDIKFIVNQTKNSEEYGIVKNFIKILPKKSRIIDGGCGHGEWVILLNELGFTTDGVDFSNLMIAGLKKHYPKYSWKKDDITNLSYKDSSIDTYFSWGVFEHFEDGFSRPLKEAYRVLRKKGYLIISVPYDNFRMRLQKRKIKNNPNDNFHFYQWRLREHELFNELSINNFEVLKINYIHKIQGTKRLLTSLKLDFLPTFFFDRLVIIISKLLPSKLFAHMLIAVAQKK